MTRMATVLPQQRAEGTYTFASQPRAVQQRKKYRNTQYDDQNEDPHAYYGNIMYDRRIVRGNTYAQHTLPASAQPDPIEIQRQQESRRRAIARKRAKEQLRPKSPDAVEGRKHIDVQTELYLEELSDRVEEADVEVQTDAFLDRPPSPLFVPAKSGVDVATQIEDGDEDLFNFNIEVKPILEVLVGKTVEQALLEVMEEEELANLRSQQRAFEELRNAELVEQQRLEEQERRHREEKERRMKQQRDILTKEKETADKIAARAFAQSYLSDLVPTVFGTLSDHGYFFDPVERDVEQGFLPWLLDKVDDKLMKVNYGRMVLDGIIRDIVRNRFHLYKKLNEPEAEATRPSTTKSVDKETSIDGEELPKAEEEEAAPAPAEGEPATDGQPTESSETAGAEEGETDGGAPAEEEEAAAE